MNDAYRQLHQDEICLQANSSGAMEEGKIRWHILREYVLFPPSFAKLSCTNLRDISQVLGLDP